MSNLVRLIYICVGVIIFLLSGWVAIYLFEALKNDPSHLVLGIPTTYWIGLVGSVSASGIFFSVSESLRWSFDSSVYRQHQRLQYFERHVGLIDFFDQKGSDSANSDYSNAIKKAEYRVWAFGISNGEFINEHLDTIIQKKKKLATLDVCICFVDPDTKIVLHGDCEQADLSFVQLFDTMRSTTIAVDDVQRVRIGAAIVNKAAAEASVAIDVKAVTSAGYISAMVVDNVIYVFPFTAVSKDNTRTPYMKISVDSQLGIAFYDFLSHLKRHEVLARTL